MHASSSVRARGEPMLPRARAEPHSACRMDGIVASREVLMTIERGRTGAQASRRGHDVCCERGAEVRIHVVDRALCLWTAFVRTSLKLSLVTRVSSVIRSC